LEDLVEVFGGDADAVVSDVEGGEWQQFSLWKWFS
jgi:hypothetical protein